MSRLHSTFVALVLGAAMSAGVFAAVHTVQLGQKSSASKPTVSVQALASRQAKLDHWSRTLRHQFAKHPPALPKLPKFAAVHAAPAAAAPVASAAPVAAAAPPVTYVRPKPVVKYRHAAPPKTTTTQTQQGSDDEGQGSDDSSQVQSNGGPGGDGSPGDGGG